MKSDSKRALRRDALYLFLTTWPDGVTVEEMMAELDLDLRRTNVAIRDVRMMLGDSDSIALIATPQGPRARWLYTLESTMEPSRPYIKNRIGDARTRMATMNATMRSLVAATDGRTVEGRKARVYEMGTRHIMEQIALLDGRLFP